MMNTEYQTEIHFIIQNSVFDVRYSSNHVLRGNPGGGPGGLKIKPARYAINVEQLKCFICNLRVLIRKLSAPDLNDEPVQ